MKLVYCLPLLVLTTISCLTSSDLDNGRSASLEERKITPVRITGGALLGDYAGFHCVLDTNGKVYCFSYLAELDSAKEVMEVRLASLPSTALDVQGNVAYVCALLELPGSEGSSELGHDVMCWGYGVGLTPRKMETPDPVIQISTSHSHSCGITVGRELFCAGLNAYGQLGTGEAAETESSLESEDDEVWTPVLASTYQSEPVQVAAGVDFTCVVNADGSVSCWGRNVPSGIVDGSAYSLTPLTPVGLEENIRAVRARNGYACAIRQEESGADTVWCWGSNANRKLAQGQDLLASAEALKVDGVEAVVDVALGTRSACALNVDGDVYCWGNGSPEVRAVVGLNAPVVDLAFGEISGYCAVLANGKVGCWGSDLEASLFYLIKEL